MGVLPQVKTFKVFKASVEKFSGKNIKVLRTDNGRKYVNMNLKHLCEDNGIQMQHSMPYTPQQNGVEKFKNRALKEMATCMLEDKYLSPKVWVEAINCDKYFHNIFPHKSLEYKTPFEAGSGHKSNVSHFLAQRLGIEFLPRRERI